MKTKKPTDWTSKKPRNSMLMLRCRIICFENQTLTRPRHWIHHTNSLMKLRIHTRLIKVARAARLAAHEKARQEAAAAAA